MRQRKCKAPDCENEYTPGKMGQKACSVPCAIIVGRLEEDKRKRKAWREAKKKLKTRRQWLREAQTAFNAWVRWRDRDLPCVSCGEVITGDSHASHYVPTSRASGLRFAPENVHRSCVKCNTWLSGNLTNYRVRLLHKIGAEAMEWLEGPHEPKRWSVEELEAIKKHYRQKLREAQRNELRNGTSQPDSRPQGQA